MLRLVVGAVEQVHGVVGAMLTFRTVVSVF